MAGGSASKNAANKAVSEYYNNLARQAAMKSANDAAKNAGNISIVNANNNIKNAEAKANEVQNEYNMNISKMLNNNATPATPTTPAPSTAPSQPNRPYMDLWDKTSGDITKGYNEQRDLLGQNKDAYYDSQGKLREQYRQGQSDLRDAWLKQQAGNRDTFINTQNKSRDYDISQSNAGYDNTARQNYINYMQAQKRLPSQLNALGIRGGAAESALVRMGANYGTNTANNEMARQSALEALRRQYEKALSDYELAYQQGLFDYDQDYASRLASYDDTYYSNLANYDNTYLQNLADLLKDYNNDITQGYATAFQNQLTYDEQQKEIQRQLDQRAEDLKREDEAIARAQAERAEDLRIQREKDEYERNARLQDIAREEARNKILDERYESEWQTSRQDKDLENFAGAIDGMYNKPESYENLIKRLKASDDPNKETKIMLARRALANLRDEIAEKKTVSSGGRSYSRGASYGYGGSSGYGSGSDSDSGSSPASDAVQLASGMTNAIAGGLGAAIGSLGTKGSSSKEWEKYQIPARGGRFVG